MKSHFTDLKLIERFFYKKNLKYGSFTDFRGKQRQSASKCPTSDFFFGRTSLSILNL
jgi:hypothetical protein